MDILEIIKSRRSIRAFQEKDIPQEIIEKMMEALIWAPSAGNLQSRKFYFVFNKKIKNELAQASFGQTFIAQAPLVIVGCLDINIEKKYGERGKNLYAICDVSASIENLMLYLQYEKLASCWVGAFQEEKVKKILNLSDNLRPIVICPVGYPAENPPAPSRFSKNRVIEVLR